MRVKAKKNTVRKLTAYAKAVAGVVSTLAMAVEAIEQVRTWFYRPPLPMLIPKSHGPDVGSAPALLEVAQPSRSLYLLMLLVVAVPASVAFFHWLGHRLEQHADD